MTLLLFIGLVFVYSASYYSADISFGDKFFFVKKQLFGIGVGCVGFLFFSFFDYKKLNKIKWVLYVVSIVLLAAVFIPGIGVTTYGATRWINLKILTFQPSEIAKFAFIVLSAGVLCKSSEKIKNFKTFLFVLVLGGILCALIILEPNMSITICMATLVVVMLFVGGANFKHFAWLIVPGIALVVFLIVIEPYRLKRIVAFLDPFASKQDEGFQLVQSILGVALGGFFGRGIFNSRQKYLFLPFAESDFIFSIIAEEIGFFGVFLLIFIFILLFLQIIRIAKNANSKFGCLLSSGIGSIIIIQVLFNLMVVLGLVPPTGLPLPFISAGSTAIMINMSMLGVVQNVYKQSKSRV
ncbi:MAG: cell division protein FtsW [Clostridia bacterium]|nr:cell division protein FtsW [Clostridia bacterium]